jgi:predicted DNA-binding transcriptional regulator YafY
MGRRTHTETLAKLLVAFLEEPVWKQTDLERRCGVSRRAIRTRILDLRDAGVPVEREEDHPHVYYSVSPGWFPGRGTGLESLDHVQVARLLSRLPRSASRDKILSRLVETAFGAPAEANADAVDVEDRILSMLEDSAKRSVPIRMGYYTASRGEPGVRTVSVQRILYGPRTRFLAFCHRSSKLKLFRADGVTNPELDSSVTYLQANPRDVEALVNSSLDGFAGASDAVLCSFVIRSKEAHWIVRSLPVGAAPSTSEQPHGVRVDLRTTATDILARYLTGLGAMVSQIEPDALRQLVQKIARDAIRSSGARLTTHSAGSMRSAG